mmetsp:Transcript_1339/g.5453  ORF Transcript_1339/g.5453 Transcript_1339/m.5453 type:complete len:703 (+) Transcript_1339:50-2158(+)
MGICGSKEADAGQPGLAPVSAQGKPPGAHAAPAPAPAKEVESSASEASDDEVDDLVDERALGKDGKEYAGGGGRYLVIKPLGQGSFGIVKLCLDVHAGNRPCVVKSIDTKKFRGLPKRRIPGKKGGPAPAATEEENDALKEIAIMKKLQHPNIVKLFDVIEDLVEPSKLTLILEYAPGGTVDSEAGDLPHKRLPEEKARGYFRDVIVGMANLHANLVVHRDIKPDNMLIGSEGVVKISDFGASMLVKEGPEGDIMYKTGGTPAFMSPESLSGKPFHAYPTDVWAMGITLYMLVTGKPLFVGDTVYALYDMIKADEPVKLDADHLSAECIDFITKMLDKNPVTRITINKMMRHPWVTDNGKMPMRHKTMKRVAVDESDLNAAVGEGDDGDMFLDAPLPRKTLKPGDYLTKQGDEATEAYFINKGTVRMELVVDVAGKQHVKVLQTADEGAFVGEVAIMLDGQLRTASVIADTDLEVVVVSKQQLGQMLASQPEVAKKLKQIAKDKLTQRQKVTEELKKKLEAEMNMGLEGLAELESDLETRDFAAGDFITFQGEYPSEAYFIQSGDVSLMAMDEGRERRGTEEEEDLILDPAASIRSAEASGNMMHSLSIKESIKDALTDVGEVKAGGFVGEIAILTGAEKRFVSVVAKTAVSVLVIKRSELLQMLDRSPGVADTLRNAANKKLKMREKALTIKRGTDESLAE